MKFLFAFVCLLALSMVGVEAVLDEFYCGDHNCYDVLGVKSTAKPKEIMKAYRGLAKKYHPDVRKNEADEAVRDEMEEAYILLNKAYETLNKVDNRKEYDDIVADDFRYRVLKRKYYGGGKNVYIHPLVPVVIVLLAGSLVQRINRTNMMEREKGRCIQEIVANTKWLEKTECAIKANKCEVEMAALKESNPAAWAKKALALNPVELVLHVKPVTTDEIFAVQVLKSPYTAILFLMKFMDSYGKPEKKLKRADKITKTANALGVSEAALIRRTDKSFITDGDYIGELNDLLQKKLWKPKNMDAWKEEKMQLRLKNIPKHRRALARQEMEKAEDEARQMSYKEAFQKSFKNSGMN